MEINWTILTYFIIGLFALNGFFRGWWKEAITTVLLAILVFFLQQPGVAETFIEALNSLFRTIWDILPESLALMLADFFKNGLGLSVAANGAIQFNPADGATWFTLLIVFVLVAILIGRFTLPNYSAGGGYAVRPLGSILGGLIGGLNGLIIINLVRAYFSGRGLPSGGTLPTEISQTTSQSGVTVISPDVAVTATDLPTSTIFDSFLPWVIIGLGVLLFLALLRNRVSLARRDGFARIDYREPFGYRRY